MKKDRLDLRDSHWERAKNISIVDSEGTGDPLPKTNSFRLSLSLRGDEKDRSERVFMQGR